MIFKNVVSDIKCSNRVHLCGGDETNKNSICPVSRDI